MKNRQIIRSLIVAALAASVGGPGAFAQETNIDQRLEQLEQEIRILKRQRELDQEADGGEQQAKKTPILTTGQDGFRAEVRGWQLPIKTARAGAS